MGGGGSFITNTFIIGYERPVCTRKIRRMITLMPFQYMEKLNLKMRNNAKKEESNPHSPGLVIKLCRRACTMSRWG